MLISKQYGDHVVDLFDKDTLSTITKNSQVLNGNAAISDNLFKYSSISLTTKSFSSHGVNGVRFLANDDASLNFSSSAPSLTFALRKLAYYL
jgi:hypothetical protein